MSHNQTGPAHGGDLAAARALFPDAPEPWIDLSTGINPVPYPVGELPLSVFHRLPSPADQEALEAAARSAYGASETSQVVAAPGTQALIELLPRLWTAKRVAILGPTYAEHAHAWRKAGHDVVEVTRLSEADAEIVVVVNPNNPDGRVIDRPSLLAEAAARAGEGGWLVVDEAFADFEPAESLAPVLPPNAVVLRSFGKTYGLAGIRLGFAIAKPDMAAELRARMGPWAVAGPAIELGRRALSDRDWLADAASARAADADWLDALLHPVLGSALGGTRLFRCYRSPAAPAVFDRLGRAGIWVRRFEHDRELLRFGLPASQSEWSRLTRTVGDGARSPG
ncbi:threonine-phosphate decarboxylase [Amorphus sp. 3PC139-8]